MNEANSAINLHSKNLLTALTNHVSIRINSELTAIMLEHRNLELAVSFEFKTKAILASTVCKGDKIYNSANNLHS